MTDRPADADPAPTGGVEGDATPSDADVEVDDHADGPGEPDDWYRWGRAVLYGEMLLAVLVTCFSLYLAFTGTAGFLT